MGSSPEVPWFKSAWWLWALVPWQVGVGWLRPERLRGRQWLSSHLTLLVSDGPSNPRGTWAPFPTLGAHTHSPPPLLPGDTWSQLAGGSWTLLLPSRPGDTSCPGDTRVDESRLSTEPATL